MPPKRRNRQAEDEENPHDEREISPPPPRRIEELFLRQNPPSFTGMGDPVDAELWVRSLERIFDFLHCSAQERLSCVAFQLNGPADFWWETKKRTMTPNQLENFSWDDFKAEIYDKYIPRSYRKKKESEFYNLKQEKMTVTEYDRAFCELSRHAPQQVDTEEKMSEKFRSGLRYEIRMSLAGHGDLTYSEALSRALDIEAAMPEDTPANTQSQHTGDRGKRKFDGGSSVQNRGSQSYQTEKKPWQGNVTPQGQGYGQGEQATPNQVDNAPKFSLCPRCQKPHRGNCLAGSDSCFKCGQKGHFARQCPNRKQDGGMGRPNQIESPQPLRAIQGQPQEPQQQLIVPSQKQQRAPQIPQARAFALRQKQPEKDQTDLAGWTG